ncbi:MAG: Glucose-1-phosphate thymidylyl transferase [Parcubacteria group bacterium GW2011_GWA1_36_12]|nr:MAG: Glucose-1-phosphate thymidylyl transferase [Parcubacteria group bacterium GW2011_GWA1_36_12]
MLSFDFDGTIVDSMSLLEQNAVKVLKTYFNIPRTVARRAYRISTGLPFKQQVDIIVPNNSVSKKEAVKVFEKLKIYSMLKAPLFPEVHQVFATLKKRHYKIAISSSSKISDIRAYCKRNKIEDLVNYILGYRPGFEKGRDHFNYLIKKEKINKNNICFIGDSLNDMHRANREGIYFIGRLGPMFNKSDFKGSTVINNLNDLLQLL